MMNLQTLILRVFHLARLAKPRMHCTTISSLRQTAAQAPAMVNIDYATLPRGRIPSSSEVRDQDEHQVLVIPREQIGLHFIQRHPAPSTMLLTTDNSSPS